MNKNSVVNTLAIEAPHGFREFRLVHGDICAEAADLLIVSANAGGWPTGAVLNALEVRYGDLGLDEAGLVIPLAGHSPFQLQQEQVWYQSAAGVYRLTPPARAPFKHLLMLRLPGAANFENGPAAIAAFRQAIQATFAALAALEFGGQCFQTIALPVLGGSRHYPKEGAIQTLLEIALNWLRVSRQTRQINFVVHADDEIAGWDAAMDKVLGRTFEDGDYRQAIAELRAVLLARIAEILKSESDPLIRQALEFLALALPSQDHHTSIQQFGNFGRMTAEAMSQRLCRDLGLTPGESAFGNIELLGRSPDVAKWIYSYLHCLRILGNEAVHLAERDQRIPKSLAAGDLTVILSNLSRVLDFYRQWQTGRGMRNGSLAG